MPSLKSPIQQVSIEWERFARFPDPVGVPNNAIFGEFSQAELFLRAFDFVEAWLAFFCVPAEVWKPLALSLFRKKESKHKKPKPGR